MSSIVIKGNTSGQIELAAPAVAGTNTLTLPASSGTLLTTTGDGSGLTGIPAPSALSTASGSAPSYSARAWVNFNGTGTVAIRASGNVSSITDNGVGYYSVNFTTAMPDANYSVVCSGSYTSTGTVQHTPIVGPVAANQFTATTSQVRIGATTDAASATDPTSVYVAIFR